MPGQEASARVAEEAKTEEKNGHGIFRSSTYNVFRFLARPRWSRWLYAGVAIPLVESWLVADGNSLTELAPARAILGLLLLAYIPGNLTTRALFPYGGMSKLEFALTSIFLSLIAAVATAMTLGLGEYFAPLNVTLTLTGYSISTSIIAAYRQVRNPPMRN